MGGHTKWHPEPHPHYSPITPTNLTTDSGDDGIFFFSQHHALPRAWPAELTDELLQLWERMNVALEWLLATRATMDSCQKELELNGELMMHWNEDQAIEARKKGGGMPCSHHQGGWGAPCNQCLCSTTDPHGEHASTGTWGKSKRGGDCQAFVEAFGVALWACLPKTQGALMYPLHLLTSNVPLAAILGMSTTTQLEAILGRGLMPATCIPIVMEMLAPQGSAKCQHHSSDLKQEEEETVEPNHTPKEHPCRKWQDGRLVANALKEPNHKAFSKESAVVKAARWAYFKTHFANFKEEGSHHLSSTFWDIVCSTNLLKLRFMRCRRNGLANESSRPPTKLLRPPKGTSTSAGWWYPPNHQRYGLGGHSLAQSPAVVEQFVLLPMVQERRAKWRHGGQSLADDALPPGPCLHPLSWLFTVSSDPMWQHALVCKSMAAGDSNNNGEESLGIMTMVMMTSNLDSTRTRLPHHLHIMPHHCQLDPQYWCPHQGRPFLPRPSSSLNHASFQQCQCSLITHYIQLCSGVHYVQASIQCIPLSISQHSSVLSCYVINGSCAITYLYILFVFSYFVFVKR